MSKQWEKYLQSLPLTQRNTVKTILRQLISGDFGGLDIKPIQQHQNLYRCRVGYLRILYHYDGTVVTIKAIKPRGDSYKSL